MFVVWSEQYHLSSCDVDSSSHLGYMKLIVHTPRYSSKDFSSINLKKENFVKNT